MAQTAADKLIYRPKLMFALKLSNVVTKRIVLARPSLEHPSFDEFIGSTELMWTEETREMVKHAATLSIGPVQAKTLRFAHCT